MAIAPAQTRTFTDETLLQGAGGAVVLQSGSPVALFSLTGDAIQYLRNMRERYPRLIFTLYLREFGGIWELKEID